VCIELIAKGVELIVFLRDANNEDWRDVLEADEERCRSGHKHLTIFGVCDRNVECWLCADPDWIAHETQRQPTEFRVENPKDVFQEAIGIRGSDKEEEIALLVLRGPSEELAYKPVIQRIL
jgi:hypothetical protein